MLAISLLLTSGTALAQEVGVVARSEGAFDMAADRANEDHTEVRTRIRGFARGDLGSDGTWFLEARGEQHVLVGDDVEGWYNPSLGESGVDVRLGTGARLRAGNLVERWGKLDLLPALDLLNPRDLRSGPMTPTEWQRLPVAMVVLQLGGEHVRSETILLPFAGYDPVFLRGTDWSFIRQGMLEGQLESVASWDGETEVLFSDAIAIAGDGLTNLDASMRRALDQAVNTKGLPQALVGNGEIAERIEFEAGSFDGAVMAGYMRNRQPQAELDPFLASLLKQERLPDFDEVETLQRGLSGGPFDVLWPRTAVVGAEGAAVLGPFGLRGEAVYQSHRTVRTSFGGATTTPYVGGGLGLDWFHGSSVQLTAEVRGEYRDGAPDDMILAAAQDVVFAGGGRFTLLQDKFIVQVGGSYDVAFEEYLFKPTLQWRATDTVRAEVGALLLGGATPAPKTLADAFAYTGGPASYWSQNDCASLAITIVR